MYIPKCKECLKHLVESIPQIIKAVLKTRVYLMKSLYWYAMCNIAAHLAYKAKTTRHGNQQGPDPVLSMIKVLSNAPDWW